MKTKYNHLKQILLSGLVLVLLVSCRYSIDLDGEKGNGNITTETRTVTETFEKIHVSRGIEVIVSQSDAVSISVETDENIQSLITTNVENGVLVIGTEESYNTDKSPIVRVSLPIITGLKASSGSTVSSQSVLKSATLNVDASSGSNIALDIEADFISMESSSGSEITVSGKALKVETASSSGSEINAGTLLANEIFSQTSSGSSTEVHPILTLKAKASSGSEITYKNIPKNLEKAESSGGSITQN